MAGAAIPLVLGGISTGVSALGMVNQKQQLEKQRIQQQTAASARSINRMTNLQKVLASQNARAATTGLALDSGNFVTLQENAFNQFDQDQEAANINSMFSDEAINAGKQNATMGFVNSVVSNVGSAAFHAYNSSLNVPDNSLFSPVGKDFYG